MTTHLDEILERAAASARGAVTVAAAPDGRGVRRRLARRRWASALTAVAAVVATTAVVASTGAGRTDVATGPEPVVTPTMILADGVVTEAEYRAAATAVVACHAAGGYVTEVSFDDPGGHATFTGSTPGLRSLDRVSEGEHLETCLDRFLPRAVSLGWASALGQIDLDVWRRDVVAQHACVVAATGLPIGDLEFDAHGFLTVPGQERHDLAFEYADHGPAMACREHLGLTFGVSDIGQSDEGAPPPSLPGP